MNVQPLFDLKPHNPTNWREKVRSASFDERQIIQWIMRLYLGGKPFDADVTYSTGHFWYDLPQPRFKFDLRPQVNNVIAADARALPVPSASLRSVIFDPPFVVAPKARPGIIRDRFGCYPNVQKLWELYLNAMLEFNRVLTDEGILIFKCQDIVSSGRKHWTRQFVENCANEIELEKVDEFVLIADRVIWSPNMANQKHSRTNLSYFLVFKKP